MAELFSEATLKNHKLKNRVICSAMLTCDFPVNDGYVSQHWIDQYEWFSDSGVGMIVAGAVATSPHGMMAPPQLGIWSDDYIEGLSKIPPVCHERGVPVIMLINHAGYKSFTTPDRISPSGYDDGTLKARALTPDEIKVIQKEYVDAAIRAEKAGFDGVQVQCAHMYLLDEFISGVSNKRTDRYGGSVENRARIATEIVEEIKKATGKDFIISVRMGYNTPTIEEAIETAQLFEKAGVDLLDISWSSISVPEIVDGKAPYVPADFEYSGLVYGASQIKKHVSIPVTAVWQIHSENAKGVLEKGYADFAETLRGLYVDPDWVEKAKTGEKQNTCYNCPPRCHWFADRTKCPAWNKLDPAKRLNVLKQA